MPSASLPTYAYGHDFGNAETSGVIFDGVLRQTITLPSATAPGRFESLAGLRAAMRGDEHDTPGPRLGANEYVLNYENTEWFVGELALTQSRAGTSARGDISRYWSPRSLHLLLAASGTLVPVPEYHLDVVTGLPIETFTTETRKQVKAALEGNHHFLLNGESKRAVVRVLAVVMEGAGALIAHGSASSMTQAVIDIGGRTTDLFVAEGQQPIQHLCKGKDLGIEVAADLVSSRFHARYYRPLKPQELRTLFHAHAHHQPYPALYVNGSRVSDADMHRMVTDVLATLGREIASFVGTIWNNSETGAVGSDLARVLLVGGGAYYLADMLKARIAHLTVPPRPEWANALGYAALAQELVRKRQGSTPTSATPLPMR